MRLIDGPKYSASRHARTAITAILLASISFTSIGTNLAVCAFSTQQVQEAFVKIRAGYDIAFQCPYAVPMVLMLTTHPSRDGDVLSDQTMHFSRGVQARDFFDPYGNICTRLVAPPGLLEVRSEFVVEDNGHPDEVCPSAQQWDVAELPGDVLPFLLASRYCDTEKLST